MNTKGECGLCERHVPSEIHVAIGKQVPDVAFEVFQNEHIKKLSFLHVRKGTWTIAFFYPADFTFVCPTELGALADHYEEFKKLHTEIFSVSTDTVYVHKAWHDASPTIRKIKFPMVADPTARLAKLFGVYNTDDGLARRGTFIIDPDGVVQAMEVHANSIGRSVKELLRTLRAAQFVRAHKDNVCPASWEVGDATLRDDIAKVGKI